MGKVLTIGWDADFDSQALDVFEFVNSKQPEGQKYPSIIHWMLAEARPWIAAGSANYVKLRQEGKLKDPLPERNEEKAKRMNGITHPLMVGNLTYEKIREAAAVANYNAKVQNAALRAPPFATAIDWIQALLEERVVFWLEQVNQETIKKETEELEPEIAQLAKRDGESKIEQH